MEKNAMFKLSKKKIAAYAESHLKTSKLFLLYFMYSFHRILFEKCGVCLHSLFLVFENLLPKVSDTEFLIIFLPFIHLF